MKLKLELQYLLYFAIVTHPPSRIFVDIHIATTYVGLPFILAKYSYLNLQKEAICSDHHASSKESAASPSRDFSSAESSASPSRSLVCGCWHLGNLVFQHGFARIWIFFQDKKHLEGSAFQSHISDKLNVHRLETKTGMDTYHPVSLNLSGTADMGLGSSCAPGCLMKEISWLVEFRFVKSQDTKAAASWHWGFLHIL